MVFPNIRSLQEINCLSSFDKNSNEISSSRKKVYISRRSGSITRTVGKRRRNKSKNLIVRQFNYPIAS